MEAIARHDFVPQDPSIELGFNKDDKLLLLNYGDKLDWYNAEMNGRRGLVPGNYFEINQPSWYHGRISRVDAENILQGNPVEGAFLVRLSESSPTDFSLSVKCADCVQHFRILKNQDSKYFLWSTTFNSLNELVEHYRTETVSRNNKIFLRDMNCDNQFIVQALYDFEPNDDTEGETELGFKKGDLIHVFDTSDAHWWGGKIGDRNGYFPKLYVERIQTNKR